MNPLVNVVVDPKIVYRKNEEDNSNYLKHAMETGADEADLGRINASKEMNLPVHELAKQEEFKLIKAKEVTARVNDPTSNPRDLKFYMFNDRVYIAKWEVNEIMVKKNKGKPLSMEDSSSTTNNSDRSRQTCVPNSPKPLNGSGRDDVPYRWKKKAIAVYKSSDITQVEDHLQSSRSYYGIKFVPTEAPLDKKKKIVVKTFWFLDRETCEDLLLTMLGEDGFYARQREVVLKVHDKYEQLGIRWSSRKSYGVFIAECDYEGDGKSSTRPMAYEMQLVRLMVLTRFNNRSVGPNDHWNSIEPFFKKKQGVILTLVQNSTERWSNVRDETEVQKAYEDLQKERQKAKEVEEGVARLCGNSVASDVPRHQVDFSLLLSSANNGNSRFFTKMKELVDQEMGFLLSLEYLKTFMDQLDGSTSAGSGLEEEGERAMKDVLDQMFMLTDDVALISKLTLTRLASRLQDAANMSGKNEREVQEVVEALSYAFEIMDSYASTNASTYISTYVDFAAASTEVTKLLERIPQLCDDFDKAVQERTQDSNFKVMDILSFPAKKLAISAKALSDLLETLNAEENSVLAEVVENAKVAAKELKANLVRQKKGHENLVKAFYELGGHENPDARYLVEPARRHVRTILDVQYQGGKMKEAESMVAYLFTDMLVVAKATGEQHLLQGRRLSRGRGSFRRFFKRRSNSRKTSVQSGKKSLEGDVSTAGKRSSSNNGRQSWMRKLTRGSEHSNKSSVSQAPAHALMKSLKPRVEATIPLDEDQILLDFMTLDDGKSEDSEGFYLCIPEMISTEKEELSYQEYHKLYFEKEEDRNDVWTYLMEVNDRAKVLVEWEKEALDTTELTSAYRG